MLAKSLLEEKCDKLADWLEHNANQVPRIDKLVNKIRHNKSEGHLVHGNIVKRLLEDGRYKITNVEFDGNGHDVDIELDGHINIQVWHGASTSTYNILRGKNISEYGGVQVDWEKDEQKIMSKLAQLPDNEPGILLCYYNHLGIHVLPEWIEKFSDEKVLVEMFHVDYMVGISSEAIVHHSPDFKHLQLTKDVLSALGFGVKEI